MLEPTNNFALDILQNIHMQKKPLDGPPRGTNRGHLRPPEDDFLKTSSGDYTFTSS